LCRWSVAGKRYRLYLKLPDTKRNRKLAEAKATQIEWDILSGNFDPTLAKYRIQPKLFKEAPEVKPLSVVELFGEFIEHKSQDLDRRTLEKYRALESRLAQFFKKTISSEVTEPTARKFLDFLAKYQQPLTIKDRLFLLNACWQWAVKNGWLVSNPWAEIQVKVAPKQKPKPFTSTEIKAIIEAFETGSYSHYCNYVRFLFMTGCRTAEAIGLRWRHISDDFRSIWIGETITRRRQKTTKTNKDRVFPCNEQLSSFLRAIKPADAQPDDLVFPSLEGGAIHDDNFRKRAWLSTLKAAGVPYRKPYNTRHTFISHCLAGGMNPVEVAAVTGHDVQTLYRSYAGVVSSRPKIPDLF
jgi:integrase